MHVGRRTWASGCHSNATVHRHPHYKHEHTQCSTHSHTHVPEGRGAGCLVVTGTTGRTSCGSPGAAQTISLLTTLVAGVDTPRLLVCVDTLGTWYRRCLSSRSSSFHVCPD